MFLRNLFQPRNETKLWGVLQTWSVTSRIYMQCLYAVIFRCDIRPCMQAWTQVYKCAFWMAHYGAKSQKRTKVFSNSKQVGHLCKGPLTKTQKSKLTLKTTVKTKSGGYQGSKDLKSTQILGRNGVSFLFPIVCDHGRHFCQNLGNWLVASPLLKTDLDFPKSESISIYIYIDISRILI